MSETTIAPVQSEDALAQVLHAPWWHRPLRILGKALIAAAVVVQGAPWLWLGEVLATWAHVLALLLLPFACWWRRDALSSALAVLAILCCCLPGLRIAWRLQPLVPADATALRVASLDGRDGIDPMAVAAASAAAGVELLVVLVPGGTGQAAALRAVLRPELPHSRELVLDRSRDGALLVIAARRPVNAGYRWLHHRAPGLALEFNALGGLTAPLLVPILPRDEAWHPHSMYRSAPLRRELAVRSTALRANDPILLAPQGWPQRSARWAALREAAGWREPTGQAPRPGPAWLPSALRIPEIVVAAGGAWRLGEVEAHDLSGCARPLLVVDLWGRKRKGPGP